MAKKTENEAEKPPVEFFKPSSIIGMIILMYWIGIFVFLPLAGCGGVVTIIYLLIVVLRE